jgi:outer membrane protein, heavy metal efflux system
MFFFEKHSRARYLLLPAIAGIFMFSVRFVWADQNWLAFRPEKPRPLNQSAPNEPPLPPPDKLMETIPEQPVVRAPVDANCPCPQSLSELEAIALKNNPTLSQAASRVHALQGKMVQAGLYPNPHVGYVGEEMGNDHTAGMQGASVGQTYITGGKLQLSQATIAKEIAQSQWACQTQRLRVLSDVRLSYLEFLTARQSVDLHAQLLEIGRAGLKAAESLHKAQEVSRVDILQAKIEADSAAMQWRDAQFRKLAAGRRLAAVLGAGEVDLSQLEGNLELGPPLITWEDSIARLRSQSPELARSRLGVERARYALDREIAGRKPDVDAEIRVMHNNENSDNIASFNVGLPLPLWNRNQGNIARAQAELNAACFEVQRIELQIQERLTTVFRRYENARNQVDTYARDLLPSAKESLDLASAGYRQGEIPYLDLLTAQRTFFRVKMAYLDALKDLQASSVLIEGMLLEGSLGQEFFGADSAANPS